MTLPDHEDGQQEQARGRKPAVARTLAVSMLVVSLAFMSIQAEARGSAKVFTQGPDPGFKSKPSRLYYGSPPFLVGVRYEATRLRWRGWGRAKTRANGRLEICPNMSPCTRLRTKVVASGLVRNAEGAGYDLYSYVSFRRRGTDSVLLKLCVYGEVCRPGPVK